MDDDDLRILQDFNDPEKLREIRCKVLARSLLLARLEKDGHPKAESNKDKE